MTKSSNFNADPLPQINEVLPNLLTTFEQEDSDQNLKKLKIKDIRIVFFASRDFVIPVIETVNDLFNLVAIVTVPDQPIGRHYQLTPTPVKQHFLESGITIFDFEKLDQYAVQKLAELKADLFVVAAYGNFLPDDLLKVPKYGVLNLHPSLLPKYRGPSPIQNAILSGDKQSGMSFMLLDSKMDHGPIIYQFKMDILDQDNMQTLGNKLFHHAAEEIGMVINHLVKGSLKPEDQNHKLATFTKLIKKEDGYFDIENPPSAEKLDLIIRAYYPWPTAWTKWNGKVIKFLPEGMVQMEGKKAVKFKDFLNGYPNFPLEQL